MANRDSVNYAYKNSVPSVKIPVGQEKASEFVCYDEYVAAAALTAADVIRLGISLPAGAIVTKVDIVNPAGGGTIDLGVTGTATKYATAAAAGATAQLAPLVKVTSDEDLIATVGGTPASAGTYKFVVKYAKY